MSAREAKAIGANAKSMLDDITKDIEEIDKKSAAISQDDSPYRDRQVRRLREVEKMKRRLNKLRNKKLPRSPETVARMRRVQKELEKRIASMSSKAADRADKQAAEESKRRGSRISC